jgi:GAF domain-containing protein
MSLTPKRPLSSKKKQDNPRHQDLAEALAEARRQQASTADVLKVISRSAFDLQALLDTLVRSAAELSDSSSGIIYLQDDNAFRIKAHFGMRAEFVRYLEQNPQKPGRGSVGGRVLLTGAVQNIPDAQVDEEYDPFLKSNPTTRALLGVPLLRDGKIVGGIFLARAKAVVFSQRQIELVQSFADQAVIAIENVRLFDEAEARTRDLEESLEQQTATADVLKAISRSAFDLDTVLESLISTAVRLCNATRGGQIFRRHGDVYRYAASQMSVDPVYLRHEQTTEIKPGRGTLIGRVALENQVVHIVDAWNDPEYAEKDEARVGNVRAMLGVPLMRNGEPIGAFALGRAEPVPFTQRQIDLVTTFADQAVIAIENVRLFDEVQAKTRDLEESLQQQTATADVLKVISRSTFDLQAVFETLLDSAIALSGAWQGTICIRDGDAFTYRAVRTAVGTEEFDDQTRTRLLSREAKADRTTLAGRAVLSGKVEQIEDIFEDPEYWLQGRAAETAGIRAVLGVPLLRNDRAEGALVLSRRQPGRYSPRVVELIRTFADQAVIAIENARLFDEVQGKTRDLQESLEQQTASAEILRVISSSPTDVQPVFDAIAHSAAVLCEAANGTVFRLQDGLIHLVGYYSLSQPQLASVQLSFPAPLDRGTASGRAILGRGVVHIDDIAADREYSAHSLVKTGLRSVLSVPMLRNGEPIGSINVSRAAVRPFSERQIELLKTFADQAVIAINNVGLFNETREALEQQKATADVLKVISRSAFDLQAVLTTLAESARELCGASFVTLFMRDRDEMRLRAESGCTPEIVAFLHANPIKAGRETFTGRVMMSREAVHLPDVLADPEYDFGDAPRIGNYRTLLGVPLLRDGQDRSKWCAPSPTRPSSRSKTRACSMRCRPVRESSPRRSTICARRRTALSSRRSSPPLASSRRASRMRSRTRSIS